MPSLRLEIPFSSSVDELQRHLNDTLRRVAEELRLKRFEQDVDAAGKRITNLADPRNPGDAISQRAADRRYLRAVTATADGAASASGSAATAKGTSRAAAAGAPAGMLVLSVPGTLSIRSSAAPLVSLPEGRDVAEVVALVKQAPRDADLKIDVLVNAAKWASVAVPKDKTEGRSSGTLPAIAKDQVIALDITQVGLVFPGADLTVMLRFR